MSTNIAFAQKVIYENDFEKDELFNPPSNWELRRSLQWTDPSKPCMNGSNPAQWMVKKIDGSKRAGISISGDGCVTEITPRDLVLPDSSNYEYEVDLTVIGNIRMDRNIAFKYKDPGNWYGIKINHPSLLEVQKNVNKHYPDLGNITLSSYLSTPDTYKFKFRIVENFIEIYINNNKVYSKSDVYPVLDATSFALQASVSNTSNPSEVYFDNIKVTDLSTPKPLTVPYFSQRDSRWATEPYDHTDYTIEDVGCALASGTMVMNFFGHEQINQEEVLSDLDVLALNDWLIDSNDHSYRQGMMSWIGMTKLSKSTRLNNAGTKKLQVWIEPKETTSIDNAILEEKIPVIIKYAEPLSPSGSHFVVVNGVEEIGKSYQILDPWNQANTTWKPGEKALEKVIKFTETDSDFSFIVLHADKNLNVSITDPDNRTSNQEINHIPRSTFDLEKPILHRMTTTTESSFWEFTQKYPQHGIYQIQLTANTPGFYEFELFVTNSDAETKSFKQRVYINGESQFVLDYNSSNTSFVKVVSWETLRKMIHSANENNWVSDKYTKHLLNETVVAEKVFTKTTQAGLTLLRVLENTLQKYKDKEILTAEGYLIIENELKLLIESLSR